MTNEELVAEMRDLATRLEKINDLYEGNAYQWSPKTLRYEADYLEAHP